MKPQEQKDKFVIMRAEGKSYDTIAHELGIAKSTCTSWERELKQRIAELKAQNLDKLYSTYYMTREARIEKLGGTLAQIDTALSGADLTQVAPERLLEYKLKFTEALKGEYIPTAQAKPMPAGAKPVDMVNALGDLLGRVQAGEVTPEQANRESAVIGNMLRAYDATEIKAKLDMLESIIGGRS